MVLKRIIRVILPLTLICLGHWAAAKDRCSLSLRTIKPIKGISLGMSEERLERASPSLERSSWLNGVIRYHETDYSNGSMVDAFVESGRVIQITLRFEDYYPKNVGELASGLHKEYGLPPTGWMLPYGVNKENAKNVGEVACLDFTVLYSSSRDDVKGKLDPAVFVLEQSR